MSVHVPICPLEKRGEPIRLFTKGKKIMIYCRGQRASPFDTFETEYNPECLKCKDWIHHNKCKEDILDYINSLD